MLSDISFYSTIDSGHTSGISAILVMTGEQLRIASGGLDGTIKFWNCETNFCDMTLHTEIKINCMIEYPVHNYYDTITLICGGDSYTNNLDQQKHNNRIQFWSIKKYSLVKAYDYTDSVIYLLELSLHDNYLPLLAVGSASSIGFYNVYSDQTIKLITDSSLALGANCLLQSRYSGSTFDMLIAGGNYKNIKIYNLDTGYIHSELKGHNGQVFSILQVKWKRDDTTISSAGSDGFVRLWNISSNECIGILPKHDDTITSVLQLNWDKDDTTLVTCSVDRLMKMWDADNVEFIGMFEVHPTGVLSLNQMKYKDKTCIISGSSDGLLRMWNVGTKKRVKTFDLNPIGKTRVLCQSTTFKNDGVNLFSAGEDHVIRQWTFNSYQSLVIKYLYLLKSKFKKIYQKTYMKMHLMNFIEFNYSLENTLLGHSDVITSMLIASDPKTAEKLLITGGLDSQIKVWNLKGGTCKNTLRVHKGGILCIDLYEDNKIISSSKDDLIIISNYITSKTISVFTSRSPALSLIVLNAKKKVIVTLSSSYKVQLFSSKFKQNAQIEELSQVNCLIRIPKLSDNVDDQLFACGGTGIGIFTSTGKCIHKFKEDGANVLCMTILTCNKSNVNSHVTLLACADMQMQIDIWKCGSYECIVSFKTSYMELMTIVPIHFGKMFYLAISADGLIRIKKLNVVI